MATVKRWIDVSAPIVSGMAHWPGEPPVRVVRRSDMRRGDGANGSVLSMSAHTGTHMDAPFHFLKNGAGIDRMPPEATVGPARVLRIDDADCVRPEHLRPCRIRAGERILLRTRNSKRRWWRRPFFADYAYLSEAAARLLAKTGIRSVGIDYLSIAGFRADAAATHRALLSAGIWIIEGLDLSRAPAGRCELICLPLRIEGADGAPARAFLRRR